MVPDVEHRWYVMSVLLDEATEVQNELQFCVIFGGGEFRPEVTLDGHLQLRGNFAQICEVPGTSDKDTKPLVHWQSCQEGDSHESDCSSPARPG